MDALEPQSVDPRGDLEGTLTERTSVVSHGAAYLFGRPIGEILVESFGLPREKLEEALLAQKEKGGRLGEVLVGLKAIDEEQVARALGAQLDLAVLKEIRADQVDLELVRKVPINFAKQAQVLPLARQGEVVPVAVHDPLDTAALDHIRALVGQPIEPRLATAAVLLDAINAAFDRASH
jgi:general secretion pathway protein E